MINKFHVGERATLVDARNFPQYDGRDVEIVETLGRRPMRDPKTKELLRTPCYMVMTYDRRIIPARPRQLKKKLRKLRMLDQTVSWLECPWRPARIRPGKA